MKKDNNIISGLLTLFGKLYMALVPIWWIIAIPLMLLKVIRAPWPAVLLLGPIIAAGCLTAVTLVLVVIGCIIYTLRGGKK